MMKSKEMLARYAQGGMVDEVGELRAAEGGMAAKSMLRAMDPKKDYRRFRDALKVKLAEGGPTTEQKTAAILNAIKQNPDFTRQDIENALKTTGFTMGDVETALASKDAEFLSQAARQAILNPIFGSTRTTAPKAGESPLGESKGAFNALNDLIQNALANKPNATREDVLRAMVATGMNEEDLRRATGRSLSDFVTVLPPPPPLPPLTETFQQEKAPAAEAPPLAVSPGAVGLDQGTQLGKAIAASDRVTVPGLDTTFRASAPRTPVYDRFGRVANYNYGQAASLKPATGTNVFNWTPPTITSKPRSLLNLEDVPGVTIDPVTGQTRMPLSASQQFARDRSELDRQVRSMYAKAAAADTSLPSQMPYGAAAAFRQFAMTDPTTAAQLRMRDIEQTPYRHLQAQEARSQYGQNPYLQSLQAAFDPFLANIKPQLAQQAQAQKSYFERNPDVAAEFANPSTNFMKEMKERYPTPDAFSAWHYYQQGGQNQPWRGPLSMFSSPYQMLGFKDGGEATTEDFLKKQSGGDVSRETASPETRKTRLPSGVQRAVSKAQESRTVVPVPRIGEARQFMSGFIGTQPDYSVMDPNYKALGSAYRTGEQTSVAADVFGALTPFATASALSKASQIPGIAELIAYHGSPHRFRVLDASKIGTGEGAQAYGYGLYFAESPSVAKEYAINLANRDVFNQNRLNAHANAKRLATLTGSPKYAADDIRSVLEMNPQHEQANLLKDTLAMLESGDYAKPLKNQGFFYTFDIPDKKIAQMLDWDKPLNQQSKEIQRAVLGNSADPQAMRETAKTYAAKGDKAGADFLERQAIFVENELAKTGEGIYLSLVSQLSPNTGSVREGMFEGKKAASEFLRSKGIPGIRYLDQGSRNKPLNAIKREFLDELPEDAGFDEVMGLIGTGKFSPKNEALIKELAANDWLGFDYPAQALSATLSPDIRNYSVSSGLRKAISDAQEGGTRNVVVFPGEEQNVKMLNTDGIPIEKQDGGEVTTEEFIKKNVSRGTSEVPQVDTEGRLIDEREEIRSESQRMLNRLQSQPSKLPPGIRRTVAATKEQGKESMFPVAAPARDLLSGILGASPTAPGSQAYRTGQALANMPPVQAAAAIPAKIAASAGDAATALAAMGPAVGAVMKPKGGNWLAPSVERGLNYLIPRTGAGNRTAKETLEEMNRTYPAEELARMSPETRASVDRAYQWLEPNVAIQNWIEKKLTKYVKNEMATPEDPVRALAERGILHVDPEQLNSYPGAGNPTNQAVARRALSYPEEGLARSEAAKRWETASDYMIQTDRALNLLNPKEYGQGFVDQTLAANPWLTKVDPYERIYGVDTLNYRPDYSELGFDHLIDELKNSLNPNSGLPQALQLTPKQLDKVSVPQAVELVDKINKWRADQKAAADLKRSQNAATVEYKAYDTVPGTTEPNKRGLRWVELKPATMSEDFVAPDRYSIVRPTSSPGTFAIQDSETGKYITTGLKSEEQARKHLFDTLNRQQLEDALKYEGEVMGHCVGGYCPDVEEGRSRIYSLRDAKGEPHVTIEVKPNPSLIRHNEIIDELRRSGFDLDSPNVASWDDSEYEAAYNAAQKAIESRRPAVIAQIKGKANRAPKDEYLPFVQDFVRSGNWSEVDDLQNTGLIVVKREQNLPGSTIKINPGYYTLDELRQLAVDNNMSQDMLNEWMRRLNAQLRSGAYKDGGPVNVPRETSTSKQQLDKLAQVSQRKKA